MEDSLYFNEQHYAVRDMVRAFAREEVAPVASRLDAAGDALQFPGGDAQELLHEDVLPETLLSPFSHTEGE